jgi:hypothetical protein
MLSTYRIDPVVAREVMIKAMLNEQPLRLGRPR